MKKIQVISIIYLFTVLNLLNTSCFSYDPYNPGPPKLHLAVDENDIEEVKKLLAEEKIDINLKSWDDKTVLFYTKSLEMMEFLIDQGADVKIKDDYHYTPLHFANSPAIAKFFLDQGLDIEIKDKYGETPLYKAVFDERYDVAEFLFKRGANPYVETNIGWSALDRAKEKSKWYTSQPNNLVELFETYTPPNEKDNSETKP